MVLNPRYRVRNLLAFNFAGFACISFVVFVLATQPFYLTDVLGIKPEKVGSAIGTLGALDELTSVVVAPLWGTLNDRINGLAWQSKSRYFSSGPRLLELAAFVVLGFSLLGYGRFATHVFPDLWFWRALFAVGVTGCMSIVTVMLHEVNNSDFSWNDLAVWHTHPREIPEGESLMETEDGPPLATEVPKRHGKLAALLGVSTGLGAIFSISVFLTMPVRLSDSHPELSSKQSLKISYMILGGLCWVVALVVFAFAYDCVKQRKRNHADPLADAPKTSYWTLLKEGIEASRSNKRIQLAYFGAFVSRSTAVATSVFIPLMVYKFYYNNDKCGDSTLMGDLPLLDNCYDGYIFLAILTGVAQTVALISAPLWGILVDSNHLGCLATLLVASACGIAGAFGLCIVGSNTYDPRNAACFVLVSLIGLSQIGTIIGSMSLLSSVGQSADLKEHRVIGSISGLYSLCGGLGILMIAKIGGSWSDTWVYAPFFLLGLFNAVLAIASVRTMKKA